MNRKYEGLIVLNTKGKEDSVDELVSAVAKEMEAEGAKLDEIFTPEMLAGGYRKKYLRATSRLLALSRFEVAAG